MTILIGYADRSIFEGDDVTIASIRINKQLRIKAIFEGRLPIRKSVEITLFGEWEKHRKHGKQFKVNRFEKTRRAGQSITTKRK